MKPFGADDRGVYAPFYAFFIAGVIGGMIWLIGMLIARAVGVSGFSLPMFIGSRFTRTTGFGTWVLGAFVHLLGTGLTGWIYGTMFRFGGWAGWRVGGVLGIAHWLIGGAILGMFAKVPGLPKPPGLYGANYGTDAVLELGILFILYGLVVGELLKRMDALGVVQLFSPDDVAAISPLADSLGQDQDEFEGYKKKRGAS